MTFILVGLVWLFFKFTLPVITKHGQAITVPNLKGIPVDEMQHILSARHLRYKITQDVLYFPNYPPDVVLEQYPKAGARVKEGRSIYITLNATQPPEVLMPNLVDGSVRNAHISLKSRGLGYHTITYVTDIAKNAVLEQLYKGQPIAPGTRIAQGSKIDLVVGAGLEKHAVIAPDVVEMKVEEAELLLLDIGLCVGNVNYEHVDTFQPGTVFRQQPKVGSQLNLGTRINLWVVEANPQAVDTEAELDQPIIETNPALDTATSESPGIAADSVALSTPEVQPDTANPSPTPEQIN